MGTLIYSVHERGPGDLRVVADRFDFFAFLLPPLWAIWHGAWVTLAAQAVLLAAAALWLPLVAVLVFYGIALILGFEGGSIRRAELGLRGWREVGLVEARSPDGAEELFLRGELL